LTVRRAAVWACLVALAVLVIAPAALAAWSPGGSGTGAGQARTMPAGNTPTASVSNRSVTVSWSQSSFSDGPGVEGYVVKRYSTGGTQQTIGSNCSGTITGLSCTEDAVPSGSWRYSVTPKQGGWSGAESAQSTAVTVVSPGLTLDTTSVTSLPSTISGSISGFVPGQTVTFRLDNPTTGTVLTGSISPTPVPANGSATVSVTIPSGTSPGSHTVYAVGSGGDTASRTITVGPLFVRNVGSASCGGLSLTVTVPAAGVEVGDTLILRLALGVASPGSVAASDSKGNTYTVDEDVLNLTQRAVVLRARVTAALTSGNTITVTFPAASSTGLVVDEFSGIAAASPVDVSGAGTGNSTAPSASVATTNARDLLIGAVSFGTTATATQPSGWTALTAQTPSCLAFNEANVGGHRVVASTGSYAYNPTMSTSSVWAAAVVAYKAG
jgi:hypothetical protein